MSKQEACLIVNTYIVPAEGAGSWAAALNVAWRMVGNYKDMSGFIMISAFADSRFAHAALLSKQVMIVCRLGGCADRCLATSR